MSFLEWFVISILICVLLVFLVPLIYGIVKKKYWILIAEGAVVLAIVVFCYVFPTRFPYMDRWITGKTEAQVVSVYGQPDVRHGDLIAYDLGPDKGFLGIMSDAHHWYYYIRFNSDGVAYEVFDGGPIGG